MEEQRKYDRYLPRAIEALEAGFTSFAAQGRALGYVNHCYDALADAARDEILTAADAYEGEERRDFIDGRGYWNIPHTLHNVRDKHAESFGSVWNRVDMLRDLREAIRTSPLVKVERKADVEREADVLAAIRDAAHQMAQRREQFIRGVELAHLFGGLRVSANVHYVTNQQGHTFLRAFYYLNGEFTALQVIVAVAQELEQKS